MAEKKEKITKEKATTKGVGKKTKEKVERKVATEKSSATVAQYSLLRAPIVTEKSAMVSTDRNRVVFQVDCSATKTEIKAAVEAVFGVQVKSVHTLNMLGKVKRTARSIGRQASYKKAYVTVKKGQTIDVVEGL